jgi:hypothetical protein
MEALRNRPPDGVQVFRLLVPLRFRAGVLHLDKRKLCRRLEPFEPWPPLRQDPPAPTIACSTLTDTCVANGTRGRRSIRTTSHWRAPNIRAISVRTVIFPIPVGPEIIVLRTKR